ncbi:MAG: hypothetical protein LCH73_12375 [Proteobacteria bacterium]|nr:hypothetical protein [Pseudomonadota bacterium]
MKIFTTCLKWLFGLAAGFVLLCVAAGLALAWTLAPADAAIFEFGNQAMTVHQLGWAEWLALGVGLAVAGLVVSVTVPLCLMGVALALLLGLGVPLLLVSGLGVLLAAPLLVLVWLLRRSSRPTTP